MGNWKPRKLLRIILIVVEEALRATPVVSPVLILIVATVSFKRVTGRARVLSFGLTLTTGLEARPIRLTTEPTTPRPARKPRLRLRWLRLHVDTRRVFRTRKGVGYDKQLFGQRIGVAPNSWGRKLFQWPACNCKKVTFETNTGSTTLTQRAKG